MAAPPQSKSISIERIPSQFRDALAPLVQQLNPFMLGIANGLTKGLTFAENFAAQLQIISVTGKDDWIAPTLGNGWLNTGGGNVLAQYRKSPDGAVVGHGLVTGGTTGVPIYNLPAPYRQLVDEIFPAQANQAYGNFVIKANGDVIHQAGSTTNFSLIFSFIANDRTPVWTSQFPIFYASTLPGPMRGIWIIGATVTDQNNHGITDPKTPVGPLWVDAIETTKENSRSVKIRGISGLVAGKSYKIALLSIAG